jgi:anti-sigma regulatory factor (Ser/Thr protein kinase)
MSLRESLIHDVALAALPESVRVARRFTASCLARVDSSVRDVVVLLVSEVVTNAVRHGGPHARTAKVGLSVKVLSDRVRVEVKDDGSMLPVVGDGAIDNLSGRGLLLVEGLATRWGFDRSTTSGKTVWLEVAR